MFDETHKIIRSNKQTQEFEYFIHLIDPGCFIYSSKKYSETYQDFLHEFSGKKIQTNSTQGKVIPWCNDFSQISLSKKLQYKANTLKLMKDNDLLESSMEIVSNKGQLETNYLYKSCKSLSGMGHFCYPKDSKRIKALFQSGETLIKEELLQREIDFSTLFFADKKVCTYINEVDRHFQYKGSTIGGDFSFLEPFQTEYEIAMKLIQEHAQGYQSYFSIDSFIYKKDSQLKLYPACEINARKTMGFVAHRLKEIYFPDTKIIKMKLIKNKGEKFNYSELSTLFHGELYLISPLNNIFFVFILIGDNEKEILDLEKRLLLRFF